jgi:hypothetical protein
MGCGWWSGGHGTYDHWRTFFVMASAPQPVTGSGDLQRLARFFSRSLRDSLASLFYRFADTPAAEG